MDKDAKRDGLMSVMLHRFETHQLPMTLQIKEKVDNGEVLSDWAREFLDEVVRDISQAAALVDSYPEFHALYGRVAGMYRDITAQALKNESGA